MDDKSLHAPQTISRFRRTYNQWVANQTLEDFALRFTAVSARKWSAFRVSSTAMGAISFLALEAIGGTITLSYGFHNAAWAIVVVSLLIFIAGLPICYYAARYGVDIDLLSRGAGFGYIGSTITSLIYASFTFIFFAIEAAIMATALELFAGVPLFIGYFVSALVVIPLVTHGITYISRFQLWTQPLWIVLQLLPFVFLALSSAEYFSQWTQYPGVNKEPPVEFNLLLFGAAATVTFSLIAQIGEQVDFLRFLPEKTPDNSRQWWSGLLMAGPGWIVLGAMKMFAGSFLAYLAITNLVPLEDASDPSHMYLVAFQHVFQSPAMAIAVTGIFIVISQLKINVTNAYAGSIAWSNFFSRLTHSHPGRVVWLVFNVIIALMLMELGVYKALEDILGLYSIVAVAWVGTLVADLVVNKPFGLSPSYIEFKRAHLYDINPVGTGAMFLATLMGALSFSGLFGQAASAMAPFITLLIAFFSAPIIALLTHGKYYLARTSPDIPANVKTARCCICEHSFEVQDIAHCPAYNGYICSLCCSLDARCDDSCKENAKFPEQILQFLNALLPEFVVRRINTRFGHYLGLLLLMGSIMGAVLGLIYFQTILQTGAPDQLVGVLLWKIFFILMIVYGVAAWLFVLANESRHVAEEESKRQTVLLFDEIRAHKRTDEELQRAKEMAEAANLAKSRYVVGLSHEFRTPLNAIFGYAQLLENDQNIPPKRIPAIGIIRRSAEHLSDLIDGLLDISKIEAGRLPIYRDEFDLAGFLEQIVDMFRLQTAATGINFVYEPVPTLPRIVATDEKRLRQVLINLLTNAIKFTSSGTVSLRVSYRSQVISFEVIDSGVGISDQDLERIFLPFERVNAPVARSTKGTGLGLAITKLLTEVLGGEISVRSKLGSGSTFKVKMFLPEVAQPSSIQKKERLIIGYKGQRQKVLVVDDEPAHRALVDDLLTPLGFVVYSAEDGYTCLELLSDYQPDVILLDISMPGLNGWKVARAIRERGFDNLPIVMVSANVLDKEIESSEQPDHDAYLSKPIHQEKLLDVLGKVMRIEWKREAEIDFPSPDGMSHARWQASELPPLHQLKELINLGQIGHVSAIHSSLKQIETDFPASSEFCVHLRKLMQEFQLAEFMSLLEACTNHDGHE